MVESSSADKIAGSKKGICMHMLLMDLLFQDFFGPTYKNII